MKYADWLSQWLYCNKSLLKVRTYERYAIYIHKQIVPRIGDCDLEDLSAAKLQFFAVEISQIYSPNTVKAIILLVKRSLRNAEEMGAVPRQNADKIRFKARTSRTPKYLNLTEQRKLERYILSQSNRKLFGIIICLYTGLRIGELLALNWSDIDFKKSEITVNKSCHDSYLNGKYQKFIDTPKTPTSERRIPLPKQLVPFLKNLKKKSVSGFVVEGNGGKTVSVRSYENTFAIILKRLDIQHMGFHSLRHTFATRALENGMDVKTLSEILGHSNASVTLNCYAHSLPEHKSAMMNKLGKMFQAYC